MRDNINVAITSADTVGNLTPLTGTSDDRDQLLVIIIIILIIMPKPVNEEGDVTGRNRKYKSGSSRPRN